MPTWWDVGTTYVGPEGKTPPPPPELVEAARNTLNCALLGMTLHSYRELRRINAEKSNQSRAFRALDPNSRNVYYTFRVTQRAAVGAIQLGCFGFAFNMTRFVLANPPKEDWEAVPEPKATAIAGAVTGALAGLSLPGTTLHGMAARVASGTAGGVLGGALGYGQAVATEALEALELEEDEVSFLNGWITIKLKEDPPPVWPPMSSVPGSADQGEPSVNSRAIQQFERSALLSQQLVEFEELKRKREEEAAQQTEKQGGWFSWFRSSK